MDEADAWAPLAERFVDKHYGTLRGRVRTHVIDAHLGDHLPPPPASLVDIGGGGGNQSIPLAARGYAVTIVDPSAAMLDRARSRLAAEPADTAARVRLVQADAEHASKAVSGERFNAVLCHGVIMYVEDPKPFVRALADLAQPGGIISLVAKNASCLAARPALEGRWADALAAFDGTRQVNGLGVDTRADTVDHLTALLAESAVDVVAWYGVRLFTDGWTSAVQPGSPALQPEPNSEAAARAAEDTACAVELEASRRDPYRQLSRLFHLVGTRR